MGERFGSGIIQFEVVALQILNELVEEILRVEQSAVFLHIEVVENITEFESIYLGRDFVVDQSIESDARGSLVRKISVVAVAAQVEGVVHLVFDVLCMGRVEIVFRGNAVVVGDVGVNGFQFVEFQVILLLEIQRVGGGNILEARIPRKSEVHRLVGLSVGT